MISKIFQIFAAQKILSHLRFANDYWNTEGVPFLKDAQSNIFTQVDEVIGYNSHSIVIAKVLHAQSADLFDGLIYADGGYLS